MSRQRHTRRRFLAGTASTTLALGLAGCSSQEQSTNDNNSSAAEGGSDSGTQVTMVTNDSGNHFDPHVVRIEPGETVTWSLESGTHTTTAYAQDNDKPQRIPEEASAWDSGTLSEGGATFEHTFETPGVYDYFCAPHESTGMLGTVVVGDPDLDGQPGMAEPQSSLPDGAQEKISELNEKVRGDGESGGGGHNDSH